MIGELQPYPAYKESGEPWLGEVPCGWSLERLKALVSERAAKGYPDEPLLAATQTMGVVRKDRYENRTVVPMKDLHLLKLVERGDFVISLRSFQGGIEFARDQGIISPAYTILRTKSPEHHGFLARLFKSWPYIENLSLHVTGIRQGQNIDYERLRRSRVPLPPLPEQAAIVRYLDHVDRRIRRYIRAKQRLIALLEEQKQAIIHQAVTRGLDPDVPTKDSGVEWLGDVPEHWEVAPFKHYVGFQEGPGIMAVDFRDAGVPLLRISCLHGDVASLDGCNFLDPAMVAARWHHFRVREGDYLLSASASTGAVSLATDAVAGSVPYTGIIRLWASSPDTHLPFVKLFVGSRPFQTQIEGAKSGVAIAHFGPAHLKRMFMLLPPYDEQRAIVESCNRRSTPLEAAIASMQSEVSFLREYRTRLIADIVTGKLDVCEAAASLPDEPERADDFEEVEDLDESDLDEAGEGSDLEYEDE